MERRDAYFSDYPDVVKVPQLCEMLGGIGKDTAYRLIRQGKIECIKIGRNYRITKHSILTYLGILPID